MNSATFPVCSSLLLQDFTIQLGRSLKGARYRNRTIKFERGFEDDGVECLRIEAWHFSRQRIWFFLWATGEGKGVRIYEASKGEKRIKPDEVVFTFDAKTLPATARLVSESLKDFTLALPQWDRVRNRMGSGR